MSALVPETTPAALRAALATADSPLLIDVRTPAEFAEGHIEGALNLPLNEFPTRFEALKVDHERVIVTICRSARRTIPATRLLLQLGYAASTQLAGGMMAWQATGPDTGPLPPED